MSEQKEVEQVLVIPMMLIKYKMLGNLKPGLTYFIGGEGQNVDWFRWYIDPQYSEFKPRPEMEVNESFRQLIPYVVFVCGDQVYSYQRMKGQGESRLHGKKSIGIGGHINPIDGTDNPYMAGLLRELNEEVSIASKLKRHLMVGLINDESSAVGRVHLGILHIIELEQPELTTVDNSMLDLGFESIHQLGAKKQEFEVWSQIVIDFLMGRYYESDHSDFDLDDVGIKLSTDGIKIKTQSDSIVGGFYSVPDGDVQAVQNMGWGEFGKVVKCDKSRLRIDSPADQNACVDSVSGGYVVPAEMVETLENSTMLYGAPITIEDLGLPQPLLTLPTEVRCEREAIPNESIKTDGQKYREAVEFALNHIKNVISECETSKHLSVIQYGELDDVFDALWCAWDDPDAFNLSEVSQGIDLFLKSLEKK